VPRDESPLTLRSLPAEFVRKLNRLGFVLVEGDEPYTLVRLAIGGELRLVVQALGSDSWRLGVASRASDQPGRLPNPVLSIPLNGFGPSTDGLTLEVSTAELCENVPCLVRDSFLPMVDIAPT
jgi:hypothetical protein